MAVQHAGHDGDVVLVGERLAELGEQVRGRLDAGPVVLVEDEEAWLRSGLGQGAKRNEVTAALAATCGVSRIPRCCLPSVAPPAELRATDAAPRARARRLLVLAYDVIGERMAGPGIRYAELACPSPLRRLSPSPRRTPWIERHRA